MADESIATLSMLVGGQLSHEECVRLLNVCNNDIEQATNKWYDQGRKVFEQADNNWDSSVFNSDRYGAQAQDNASLPSFQINSVDDVPRSGAPSRPPSRVSYRSGASANAPVQSIETTQESGVTGGSRPEFGPANRDYYDSNSWAMVPITTAAEYIPDADVQNRKRNEEGPAIMKPLPSGDYLPSLLAIAHSIPQFRNALLAPHLSLADYGRGTEWWKGNAPAPARTIELDSEQDTAQALELLHEVQRIMAFLDNTQRAYASVECLLQLDAFANPVVPDGVVHEFHRFLMLWGMAYQNHSPPTPLNGQLQSVVRTASGNEESWFLDAPVMQNVNEKTKTLYDVLDDHLHSDIGNAYLAEPSNVLILRLQASDPNAARLGVKIPATLYIDRYLAENASIVDNMYQDLKQYKDRLTELEAQEAKIKWHTDKKLGKLDSLELMKTAMIPFKPRTDGSYADPNNAQKNRETLAKLQSVHDGVERKLKRFEAQKKELQDILDNMTGLLKGPMDEGTTTDVGYTNNGADSVMATAVENAPSRTASAGQSAVTTNGNKAVGVELGGEPMDVTGSDGAPAQPAKAPLKHPYKLCGISTRPTVVYLQHPDTNSNVPNAKRWWRMEYSIVDSEAYILDEKDYPLSRALRAAEEENPSVLLIYANEEATSVQPLRLSEALSDFINKDNLNFLEEYEEAKAAQRSTNFPGQGTVKPEGTWDQDTNLPTYEDTHDYNTSNWQTSWGADGGVQSGFSSSQTLTPNTEIEDAPTDESAVTASDQVSRNATVQPAIEMREINGGWEAWGGVHSNASSETVGHEPPVVVNPMDLEMGSTATSGSPEIKHIELVQKKGG